jgi:hypothetical protein
LDLKVELKRERKELLQRKKEENKDGNLKSINLFEL